MSAPEIVNVEQNTPEWYEARAGYVTASMITAVMAKPRSKGQKEATTRANYKAKLVCERLQGRPVEEEFENFHTRRGKELEPKARIEYELLSSLPVTTVGFVKHPAILRAGCSPDAFVGDDGLAQFKCPLSAIHMGYLLEGIVPVEYRPQMYFEMSCTGRKWNDFVSYDPKLVGHELFVKRLMRDEAEISAIEEEVRKFNAEVEETLRKLSEVQ